jgi:hypothetical protein
VGWFIAKECAVAIAVAPHDVDKEKRMRKRFGPAFAGALIALSGAAVPARAFDFAIDSPIVQENLAVYPIRGGGGGGAGVLTLDQAMAQGAARIYERSDGPITIQNLSRTAIFVPFGSLIAGGLQDQVVTRSLVVPPGSGRIPLETLCVDPFRSTARDGESATTFTASNMQFPWGMAKLSIVAGGLESRAAKKIRQAGVWWSIDTMRSGLERAVGGEIEPTRAAHWRTDGDEDTAVRMQFGGREPHWKTGLPLALQSRRLEEAQRPYIDGLKSVGEPRGNIVGAAFVINGKVAGAEVYQSRDLFRHMWPTLVRTYATEALARGTAQRQAMPTATAIRALLKSAEAAPMSMTTTGSQMTTRYGDAAIIVETASGKNWIHRGFIPKADGSVVSPEAALVQILDAGKIDGRHLNTLDEKDAIVPQRDPASGAWTAAFASAPRVVNVRVVPATDPVVGPIAPAVATPQAVPASNAGRRDAGQYGAGWNDSGWMLTKLGIMGLTALLAVAAACGAFLLSVAMRGIVARVRRVAGAMGRAMRAALRRRAATAAVPAGCAIPTATEPLSRTATLARGLPTRASLPRLMPAFSIHREPAWQRQRRAA